MNHNTNNRHPGFSIPIPAVTRITLLLLIMGAGASVVYLTPLGDYLEEERLLSWISAVRGIWWSSIVLILLYVAFGVTGIPSAPLLVTGAIFGPLYGTIYNVTGLFLAAMASFFMARILGREFVLHIAKGRLYRTERFLTRFGFWPLVQARFLPVPDTVVNFCAAVAGVPARIFLVASLVGLLPSTLIHTFFISELINPQGYQERLVTGTYYLGSFIIFNLAVGGPWILTQMRRRQRYRRLCLELAERNLPAKRAVGIKPD